MKKIKVKDANPSTFYKTHRGTPIFIFPDSRTPIECGIHIPNTRPYKLFVHGDNPTFGRANENYELTPYDLSEFPQHGVSNENTM